MNVGNVLRQARQKAGLSLEQISQETKIQLAKIDALEHNAFERLPDGIYLDGIVRAYARTVGLSEELAVQRVRRALELRADEPDEQLDEPPYQLSEPAYQQASGAAPIAYAGTKLGDADLDTFDRGLEIAHDLDPWHLDDADAHFETPSEFAPPPLAPPPQVPPHHAPRRRTAPILLVVIALLAASALGGYLFEHGRRALSANAVWGADAGGRGDTGDIGAAGAAGDTGATHRQRATGSINAAGATNATGRSDTRATDARAVEGTAAPARAAPEASASAASQPGIPAAAPPFSPAPASPAPAAPLPPASPAPPAAPASADVSGLWALDTLIESSAYRDYEGLVLGYRLELQQDGSRITGAGVKAFENGRTLGRTAQTPIAVQGTLEGERLTLTFTERGLRRTSGGKMILEFHDDGVLRGRFSSSSAQSVGIVEARRPSG